MKKESWNLGDILPEINSKEYDNLLKELEENTKFIENYRKKLNPEIKVEEFIKIIKTEEKIAESTSKITAYAYLWFSEDTSNQEAKSYRAKVEQISVDVNNRIMFFSLWFKNIDEKNAERIINSVPKDYKYMLQFMRLVKKYTLTEQEEKIINLKDVTGSNALIKLYDIITNDFLFTLKIKGKELKLTREQLTAYARDKNPDIRKAAYQEMYKVYSKNSDSLNELYRNIVMDWNNETIKLRKYEKPISARNISNDVSDKVINLLLEVCRKNRSLLSRIQAAILQ